MTGPGYGYPPPEDSGPRRRWLPGGSGPRRWLPVVAGVWGVVLVAAVFWSVRNDPPTVPEQQDVEQAMGVLRVASGAVAAAAQDERWALSLGATQVEECAITPAWQGQEASREVTLYVPESDARTALDTVAAGLPTAYRAGVITARGGTRLSFFADAGQHVGVEAEAHAADQVLKLHVFTGCRPSVDDLDLTDPAAGPAPAVLDTVVAEITATAAGDPSGPSDPLGPSGTPTSEPSSGPPGSSGTSTPAAPFGSPGLSGTPNLAPPSGLPGTPGPTSAPTSASPSGPSGSAGAGEARAVVCPDGGTVSTFVRDAGPVVGESGPRGVPEGTVPVWADAGGWAYRSGPVSVVVNADRDRFRVSVTTACRAG
ncbi:hypothetical protein [Actinoplanes xinjiangensis]|uniref:hypothetical protein n=1 Tax=Actinoplanes xinjiangensis TaxID=512350 RepID=UPI001B880B3A|nr:hypothetical protein [Actinoplanes xinjiangensis]